MAAKIFEVNDILPATTQLRISWAGIIGMEYLPYPGQFYGCDLKSNNNSFVFFSISGDDYTLCGIPYYNYDSSHTIGFYSPYTDTNGIHPYMDIDTSDWDLEKRTISSYENSDIFNGQIVTFNLSWEDLNAPTGYTITFNSNGGTTISDIEEATELPTPLPTPTKSGYTFVAWYYESNFQTRAKAGDTIESNVTLYAKWHNLGSLFTEIADAIRSKDGTSENIRDVDFGERVKQIQGAKEEQTKIVSPTTSSQDVLPDANKVLSKVTVNAIPTETKSQQPNLSSGNQTINATSGKFMTSFTITKDTVNHIASNIRSGKTLYGVAGNLQPAKEEETKTVTPDFSSGNEVVTPTSGKVMSQVTINKDSNLIPENIKAGVTIFGVTGTLEPTLSGYTVTLDFNSSSWTLANNQDVEVIKYMINSNNNWIIIEYPYTTNLVLNNVTSIKFYCKFDFITYASKIYIGTTPNNNDIFSYNHGHYESDTINITENITFYFSYDYDD